MMVQKEEVRFFDSHAHYDDERFKSEFPGGADGAVVASYEEGVRCIINAGTNPETASVSIQLAEKYPFVYAAAGIHPSDCRHIGPQDEEKAISKIQSMLTHPKVVALGEIGLDYHYDGTDREKQKRFFDIQLSIAEMANLPVVIHDREAHGDVWDILSSHPKAKGVIHCFSGSAEMARQLVSKGWYIAFGGSVTFKNAQKVKEAAATVPDSKLLIETDAPYLAPVPNRGKINYSGYIRHTAETLSNIRGVTLEHIASVTFRNSLELFNIDI